MSTLKINPADDLAKCILPVKLVVSAEIVFKEQKLGFVMYIQKGPRPTYQRGASVYQGGANRTPAVLKGCQVYQRGARCTRISLLSLLIIVLLLFMHQFFYLINCLNGWCFRIESKHEVTIIGGLNEFAVKFYGPKSSNLFFFTFCNLFPACSSWARYVPYGPVAYRGTETWLWWGGGGCRWGKINFSDFSAKKNILPYRGQSPELEFQSQSGPARVKILATHLCIYGFKGRARCFAPPPPLRR